LILAGALPQTPLGELTALPRPPSRNKGALLLREGEGKGKRKGRRGRERRRRGREGREGEVREGRGKGTGKGRRKKGKEKGGRKGKLAMPIIICFRRHWLRRR